MSSIFSILDNILSETNNTTKNHLTANKTSLVSNTENEESFETRKNKAIEIFLDALENPKKYNLNNYLFDNSNNDGLKEFFIINSNNSTNETTIGFNLLNPEKNLNYFLKNAKTKKEKQYATEKFSNYYTDSLIDMINETLDGINNTLKNNLNISLHLNNNLLSDISSNSDSYNNEDEDDTAYSTGHFTIISQ